MSYHTPEYKALSVVTVFPMVLLDLVLQQGEGNNGSGQEAVPVTSDGMRAPPATEAVDV